MKHLQRLLLFAPLLFLFISCQKELSNETGNAGNAGSQWEFTEASSTFKGKIDTAYLEPSGGFQTVIFEGTSSDGKGQIFMQIFGTTLTATSYKNPNVFFEYVENGSKLYSNVPTNFDKFTVVITSITATSVTGTFNGEVENAAGETKMITDGKFNLVLTTPTTPPLLGICKLSNLGYFDSATRLGYGSLTNIFNGANLVTGVKLVDSNPPPTPVLNFSLAHTPTRVNLDAEQFFDLDPNGRIKSFTGYFNLNKDSGAKVVINYSFNANGNLIKTAYSLTTAPTLVVYEWNFTWTNGNLTKAVSKSEGILSKTQYDYEYDATKTVKEFINLFPSPELFFPQAAINYGKNSTNIPTKSTMTDYDQSGILRQTDVTLYKDYVIDAKNYVQSFYQVGEGLFLYGETKYVLSYKCY